MKRILLTLVFLIILLSAVIAIARDMVVVEIGTGTWCQYCPGAAMGADDLVENHHRAAIIENHNGDSYANTYSNARNTYYGVPGWPTAYFDGGNASVGGDHTNSLYNSYRTRVNNRLAVASKYSITATGTRIGDEYSVDVTVTKLEADTNTNLKLHGVLTESGIQQNWQGQTHLEFVQRLMSPDQNGTDIDFSTAATQTITLYFSALPAWNENEFEFIFFLQNNTSKEVLQGCKYTIQALENTAPVEASDLNFGDVSLGNIAQQSITIHNWWTNDMNIDISIDNPDFFIFPQARDAYMIPFREDGSFDVFFTANTPGLNQANITITTDNPAYPSITIPVTANVSGVANEDETDIPNVSSLISVSPNPFHSTSAIKYNLNTSDDAELQIFNIKGSKILSLPLTNQTTGEHAFTWNGKDTKGSVVPSGVYFCIMNVNGKTVSSQKLIKIK